MVKGPANDVRRTLPGARNREGGWRCDARWTWRSPAPENQPRGQCTLKVTQWAQDLSPFTHVPKAPAVPITVAPVVALLAIVAGLTLTGLVALRRRNLALPA